MSRDSSSAPRFLPVGLDLRGKKCLVVGGGSVGTRKATTLTKAGAVVTVVSPTVTQALAEMADTRQVSWLRVAFRDEHILGMALAVAATDDEALNTAVVQAATDNGVLVCDASSAERSQVIFGALLEVEDVTIAVFTGGRDPAQARRTRDHVADLLREASESKPEE